MLITIPSVIAVEYPDKQEDYMGLFYMSLGIGLTLGPTVSWLLDEYIGLGYSETFFVFAGLIFVFGSVLICTIPRRLDD